MSTATWFLIQYMPDLRRQEPRNVGVVLEADGRWTWRFVAQRMAGEGTINGRQLPRDITAARMRSWVDYFIRKARDDAWDDVLRLAHGRPREMSAHLGGTIADVFDPTAEVENLFLELVTDPSREVVGPAELLRNAVDRILSSAAVLPTADYEVPAVFDDIPSTVTFDLGYKNGQLHLMNRLLLGKQAPNHARELWARMRGAREAESAQSFFVFYNSQAAPSDDLLEQSVGILDEQAHTLDVKDEPSATETLKAVLGR